MTKRRHEGSGKVTAPNTAKRTVHLGEAENTLISQLLSAGARGAADELAASGLPTRRIEAYHYTDLKALLGEVPAIAEEAGQVGPPKFRVPGAYRILVANGRIQQSTTPPNGVVVSEAGGSSLTERDDVLVMLNHGLVEKSLAIGLENSVDPIVHIDHRIAGAPAHTAGALRIEVAPGATATVLETFSGSDAAHMGNQGTRVELGDGARFTHIVVDLSALNSRHFHTIEYAVGANVQLRNLLVNSGSALSRTQMFGVFAGEGAHGDFSGLNLVDDGQHNDITLDVNHAVPNTTSQELFKSVVRNRAKAIFQGRIVVSPKAQKTDAKMMMQGLMLSEGAQILSKPELEIFADDVQCGHGSTCGELDAQSMFYMMSRGIAREDAKAMLIRAFVQELLDPIEDEELSEALSGVVEEWLSRPAKSPAI